MLIKGDYRDIKGTSLAASIIKIGLRHIMKEIIALHNMFMKAIISKTW